VQIRQTRQEVGRVVGYRLDRFGIHYVEVAQLRSWVLLQSRPACAVLDLLFGIDSHVPERAS
jgi:hypothetical protein